MLHDDKMVAESLYKYMKREKKNQEMAALSLRRMPLDGGVIVFWPMTLVVPEGV